MNRTKKTSRKYAEAMGRPDHFERQNKKREQAYDLATKDPKRARVTVGPPPSIAARTGYGKVPPKKEPKKSLITKLFRRRGKK